MTNQSFTRGTVLILCVVLMLLVVSKSFPAEISTEELLNLLKEKDQLVESNSFEISFVIRKNAMSFDPNQGIVAMDCNATWTQDGSCAMKVLYRYEKEIPVFVPPGSRPYQPADYDEHGNLIIWRVLEKHILSDVNYSDANHNDTLEKLRVFFIDPNGQVVKTGDNTLLHRWPAGDPANIYEFRQFQLAMGRGFSRHLGTVTSLKSLFSGGIKVTSEGSYGQGLNGSWELILDPNSDYLVREALFTVDTAPKPTIIVTSTGVMMKDGIKIAKHGTFKYSNSLEVSFEVTDISKVVGPNLLYEEVLSRLDSPLPAGARIYDLRSKKPVVTTVE